MHGTLKRIGFVVLVMCAADAAATNLVVYDDQSENGFNGGCSFSGVGGEYDFADTTTVHAGTHSIRFTPDDFNAVSWCAPATYSATTDYTGIDFWVNGGATGGQNVDLVLGLGGNAAIAFASLTSLNGNTAIPAGTWVHIQASFASALAYNGQFDRISLQDESGGVQTDLYFDDVSLVGASAASGQNYLFGDSFEPEYMFVPQFQNHSVRVYQRATNSSIFTFVNEAGLGAAVMPNAVAFAPDGNLWVLDDGATRRLLRYTMSSIVSSASPVASVTVGALGANAGEVFDVEFNGSYAYVSQSDFGATNRILKFLISDLNAGNNTSTNLTDASLSVPAGLAFDAQGRLWICNYNGGGSPTIVRMNASTGAVDKIGTSVAVGTRASLSNPEGLAFDAYGNLWVGNNGEPTLSVYTSAQIANAGFGATVPTYQIDSGDAAAGSGFVGGIAFDRRGDLRLNFENDLSVRGYSISASPDGSGGYDTYSSVALAPIANATTDPGRGGIAIWPVPGTVHR